MNGTTWLTLAFVAALAGCATRWNVDDFQAPEANLTARHSFFVKGGDLGTPTSVDPALAGQLDAQIRATIATELTHKGYAQVDQAADADLVVSYHVAGTRKSVLSDERRNGAPSPTTVLSPSEMQPPPASALPREQTVRDGTVIVFADDPASGRLAWRGMISAETRVGSPEAGIRVIVDMTRAILAEFPAQAGQPAK